MSYLKDENITNVIQINSQTSSEADKSLGVNYLFSSRSLKTTDIKIHTCKCSGVNLIKDCTIGEFNQTTNLNYYSKHSNGVDHTQSNAQAGGHTIYLNNINLPLSASYLRKTFSVCNGTITLAAAPSEVSALSGASGCFEITGQTALPINNQVSGSESSLLIININGGGEKKAC